MGSAQCRSSSADHHGPVLREPLEEVPDDLERAVLQRLGRELGEPGGHRRAPAAGPSSEPQVRLDLGRALAERAARPAGAARRGPAAPARRARTPSHAREQVAERPVRQGIAVGDAPALEPERRGRATATRRSARSVQLGEEPGLADPRLADDDRGCRPRRRGLTEDLARPAPRSPLAADQAGLAPLRGRAPGTARPVRPRGPCARSPARPCPSARAATGSPHVEHRADPCRNVASPTSTAPGSAGACSRAAVLTASPSAAYSTRLPAPIAPTTTGPVSIPTRTPNPSTPQRPRPRARTSATSSTIRRPRPDRPLGVVLVRDRARRTARARRRRRGP